MSERAIKLEKMSENTAQKISENTEQKMSENMAQKISENMTQKMSEMTEKIEKIKVSAPDIKSLKRPLREKEPVRRKLTVEEILAENEGAISSVRAIIDEQFITTGKYPTYHIRTYGCQMNEHDSEKIAAMLEQMGYKRSEHENFADFTIFNTCAIRENAEMRVFGNVGSMKPLKEKHKHIRIALCGCMMQQKHIVEKIKKSYPHVDLIFGTHNLHDFPKLLLKMLAQDKAVIDVWERGNEIVEGLPIRREKSMKAFVNIMYGCNKFCSYCIVPYTRGRERSRHREDILHEIADLVDSGVKEITLLGQNVDSYGLDFREDYSFAHLLRDIDAIIGERNVRVRFMTPHPNDMSDDVIDAIANLKSVCEYVHLPIQAGSDPLLRRMRRQYSVAKYMDLVNKLKSKVKDLALSTDIIIGFPGETEEDVDAIIEVIKEVDYDSAFTFIFSSRVGTPAARMKDQIPEELKHTRFEKMLNVLNEGVIKKNLALKDEVYEVLVETETKDRGIYAGRNRANKVIHFRGDDSMIGEFVNVKITNPKKFSLFGEVVS